MTATATPGALRFSRDDQHALAPPSLAPRQRWRQRLRPWVSLTRRGIRHSVLLGLAVAVMATTSQAYWQAKERQWDLARALDICLEVPRGTSWTFRHGLDPIAPATDEALVLMGAATRMHSGEAVMECVRRQAPQADQAMVHLLYEAAATFAGDACRPTVGRRLGRPQDQAYVSTACQS